MDAAIACMDKTITGLPVYYETVFRSPGQHERRLGFWVDRIGKADYVKGPLSRLRVLGQYAVVAVESGDGEIITRGKGVHKVCRGDALLLMPSEPAAYGPRRKWSTRWIVWNGPAARQAADAMELERRSPVISGGAEAVRGTFDRLAGLMALEEVAGALERQAVVLNMLSAIARPRGAETACAPAGPDWEALLLYIRGHLNARLTPAGMASFCHMSVPHFRRMFRRHTGRSPMEFVMAERIARAKSLLIRGMPIKHSAQAVGFADRFYFMRVFRKIAGQTAGQFVASNRGSKQKLRRS